MAFACVRAVGGVPRGGEADAGRFARAGGADNVHRAPAGLRSLTRLARARVVGDAAPAILPALRWLAPLADAGAAQPVVAAAGLAHVYAAERVEPRLLARLLSPDCAGGRSGGDTRQASGEPEQESAPRRDAAQQADRAGKPHRVHGGSFSVHRSVRRSIALRAAWRAAQPKPAPGGRAGDSTPSAVDVVPVYGMAVTPSLAATGCGPEHKMARSTMRPPSTRA